VGKQSRQGGNLTLKGLPLKILLCKEVAATAAFLHPYASYLLCLQRAAGMLSWKSCSCLSCFTVLKQIVLCILGWRENIQEGLGMTSPGSEIQA